MTSRERVVRAVDHQPHDRVPIDLGGTFATSLTVPAYVKLCAELGVTPKQIRVNEPMQMLVEMELPHFQAIPACLHEKSDIKFLYHSCGSVYRLMECFVELGVDALNPLQVSAAEMEPERLVREFGGRLVFWGGGCDTQRVLPEGTEEEVRAEVRSRLGHYASVPGFVFSQVHNIQPDVPPKNVLAMLDEVTRWKL